MPGAAPAPALSPGPAPVPTAALLTSPGPAPALTEAPGAPATPWFGVAPVPSSPPPPPPTPSSPPAPHTFGVLHALRFNNPHGCPSTLQPGAATASSQRTKRHAKLR